MIKLIITDMDGTLLNSKNEINDEFWEIQDKLSKQDVIFAVASGRPYYNLVERFKNKRIICFLLVKMVLVLCTKKKRYIVIL